MKSNSFYKMNGLTIIEDYITDDEHDELVSFIKESNWSNALSRRTQHYGYEYSYRPPYKVNPTVSIPDIFKKYIDDIDNRFNQIIVNEYLPGQGISPHVDHKLLFGDKIASLSLNSGVIFTLTKGTRREDIFLKPKTLLILSDEARWEWAHEIKPVKIDIVDGVKIKRDIRYSITFRIVV